MQTFFITSARYEEILENYVIPELQRQNVFNDIVWMQDDAPPHTAINVRQMLQMAEPSRVTLHFRSHITS